MTDLVPTHRLDVTYDRQAWGWMRYCGDAMTWNLVALLLAGGGGATFQGLTPDPSGEHLIQSPVDLWLDCDPAHWASGPGDAYTYDYGTDPPQEFAGRKFLRGVPPAGSAPAAFSRTSLYARPEGEGFRAVLYRGAAGAGSSFYVALNAPPAGQPPPSGWAGLRLALVPGSPIRLQASADNAHWADVAVAGSLGECEQFLSAAGRSLSVDVLPKTDPAWAAGLPLSAQWSGPPPNQIDVTVNGAAVLTVPAASFPAGALAVSGSGGQWSCRYAMKRFALTASVVTASQVRARRLVTAPAARVQGYLPYAEAGAAAITLTGPNSAYAALAVDATASADATGYAPRTVFLSAVDADFPPVWDPPAGYPDTTSYGPDLLALSRTQHTYQQQIMTARSSARLTFVNTSGEFSPGRVLQAARAATLWAGYEGLSDNPDDPLGEGLYPQVCGWTAMDPDEGQAWPWSEGMPYFECSLQGRLSRGDEYQVVCGYMLPDDGQTFYYALRQKLYRLGITDDWLNFPSVLRDQPTGYYTLPRGTTRQPALQPDPAMHVMGQVEILRRLSGEVDPVSGQVLPMVIRENSDGTIDAFGMPVGVVQAFLAPPGTPLADLGLAPAWSFGPADFLRGGYRTGASLAHIRTPVVFEGLDPASGNAVVGVAYNELLGGGEFSDPDAPGYVGLDVPFFDISKYFTSADVAAFCASLAAVQLAFPAVTNVLPLHLQPALRPLTVVAVTEPTSQGTDAPVGYYTANVASTVDYLSDPDTPRGETLAACRLLGQAGD